MTNKEINRRMLKLQDANDTFIESLRKEVERMENKKDRIETHATFRGRDLTPDEELEIAGLNSRIKQIEGLEDMFTIDYEDNLLPVEDEEKKE